MNNFILTIFSNKFYNKSLILFTSFIIISLIPTFWIPFGTIYGYGDDSILVNPFSIYYRNKLTYNNIGDSLLGSYSTYYNLKLIGYLWYFFNFLKIPLFLHAKIYIFLSYFLSSVSFFFFLKTVKINSTALVILGIFFYKINIFTLGYPFNYHFNIFWIYFPLIFSFLIKIFIEKKNYHLLSLIITSLLVSINFDNPSYFLNTFIFFVSYFLFLIYSEKISITILIGKIILIFFGVIIILSPFIFQFLISLNNFNFVGVGNSNLFEDAFFQDSLRLLKSWAFNTSKNPDNWHNYYYKYKFVILISYIPLIVTLLPFLSKKIPIDNFYKYSVILMIFYAFLAKGSYPPFGQFFYFLYKYIPGFFIFREPYTKFTMIYLFLLSLNICYSLNILRKYFLSKYLNFFITIFLIIIISIININNFKAINIYTKKTYQPFHEGKKEEVTIFNESFYLVNNFINNITDDSRILILPKNNGSYDNRVGSNIWNPYIYFNKKKILYYRGSVVHHGNNDEIKLIFNNLSKGIIDYKKLNYFDIGYIIIDKNINRSDNLSNLTYQLINSPLFELIFNFGDIQIYKFLERKGLVEIL